MPESSVMNSFCLTPTSKMNKKNLSIEVTYRWDITQSEWTELKLHQKTWENEVQTKLEYDPTFMFHVFSDISVPSLKQLRLNGKVRKVKLG
tara:strand:- start:1678 stop:1950 length:273 start_codon:yes stop_codon:yes gene_type:complete